MMGDDMVTRRRSKEEMKRSKTPNLVNAVSILFNRRGTQPAHLPVDRAPGLHVQYDVMLVLVEVVAVARCWVGAVAASVNESVVGECD